MSRQLVVASKGDMPGCWLIHVVPGLEAGGLCPPAPPL